MAAGESYSSESWWGGMLEAAKEKSSAAFQQMSKDLQEFSSTIQKDTTQAVAHSATAIGQNLKREEGEEDAEGNDKSTTNHLRDGFYNLLSNISQSLTTSETVEGETYVVHPQDPNIFDQTKARLLAIQVDPATYCNEPDEPLEAYHSWLETFNIEGTKGDISELLVANSQVRSIYTKLVPVAVSHSEFWNRYFFKIHQLDQYEARKTALKERAEMSSSQTFQDDLGWGDEDESWDTMPEASKGLPGTGLDDRLQDNTEEEENVQDGSLPEARAPPRNKENPHRTESTEKVERLLDKEEKERGSNEDDDDKNNGSGREEVDGLGAKEDDVVDGKEASKAKETSVAEKVQEMTLDIGDKEHVSEVKEDRSPTGSSNGSSGNKESSLGDEWEKDFDDIEITEEDIKNAQLASKNGTLNDDNDLDEEWESWE